MKTKIESENRSLIQFNNRAVVGLFALLFLLPVVGRGGGVVVNCTEADLRAAMAGGGTVTFAGDGTITLTNTLTIAENAVLDATGHQVTLNGNNAVRVFSVNASATLTLINLTIANGRTFGVSPAEAGGIWNLDTLNATNCTFQGNLTEGKNAVYPDPGAPAYGGAILNGNGATLNATRCSFLQNRALGGYGTNGFNGSPMANPTGGSNGGPARGGAIYNAGTMTIDSSLFANNSVAGGPGGRGGNGMNPYYGGPVVGQMGGRGGNGGEGGGGGIYNASSGVVVNCTFTWNFGSGGGGGSGGNGGHVWVVSNHEITYDGGSGGSGGSGAGAISDADGQRRALRMANCTVAFNSGSGGSGGSGGLAGGTNRVDGGSGSTGAASGGVKLNGASLVNIVIAYSHPGSDCAGTFTDLGHNLGSDASCNFTNVGSLNNTYPQLGPLADNGGPTLTMALGPGSPAIDAGDTAAAPPTDQRGFPRPVGSAVDIGAYEYCYLPVLRATLAQAGIINVTLFTTNNQICRLFASPDLVNWQCVATNQIGADGTALFQDNCGTGEPQRFYKVALP